MPATHREDDPQQPQLYARSHTDAGSYHKCQGFSFSDSEYSASSPDGDSRRSPTVRGILRSTTTSGPGVPAGQATPSSFSPAPSPPASNTLAPVGSGPGGPVVAPPGSTTTRRSAPGTPVTSPTSVPPPAPRTT